MLNNIITEDVKTPLICTIFGEPGLGKTSLAATFPNPIFILAEDGLKSVKPRPHSFPLLNDASEIWDQLKALRTEKHDYKTLVIDTISQLDQLFTSYILSQDKSAKNLASSHGGYGAAYQMLSGLHGRVRKFSEALLREKNMNIVYLAHSEIENINLPDADEFKKYDIKISSKAKGHYVGNVDLVGFIKLDIFADKSKKASDNGERVLVCHATASTISKNRFDISEPFAIEKGINVLREYCYE